MARRKQSEQTKLEMLEEIFKGAKMGMNATKLVMDKTKDTDLKNKLTGQYGSFSKTAQKGGGNADF